MAATNFTPISLYYTTTAAATPSAGNLVAGELALNTTDEKLYFKNAAGTVKLLASNAGASGTVTSVAASVPAFLSIAGSPITTSGTLAMTYSGTALPVANGGTGLTAGTSGGVLAYTATGTLASSGALTQYGVVIGGGAGVAPTSTAAGTSTTVLHGNASGTPTFGAVSLTADVSGTLPVANGGTSLTTLTANNVILGNGTSAPTFVAPSSSGNVLTSNGTTWASTAPASGFSVAANNTFTGTQSFAGTSSNLAEVLTNAAEVATVSATAATGTINYDITTQSVIYYTSNASANWTVNFRASSGTSLNTLMSTGQSMTVAFLVTQGSTAYYNSAVQVDGTTSGVTTMWLGGAPTAGNASGIDSYRFAILKTGSATFTVLASNTQFKA